MTATEEFVAQYVRERIPHHATFASGTVIEALPRQDGLPVTLRVKEVDPQVPARFYEIRVEEVSA